MVIVKQVIKYEGVVIESAESLRQALAGKSGRVMILHQKGKVCEVHEKPVKPAAPKKPKAEKASAGASA